MRRTKQEKGITLIALIITIVVLLILAVVAINSIQNDGILSHAGNTANTYNQAVKNEQDVLDGYLGYLENQGTTSSISKLEVGDYVNYTPDSATTSVTITGEESGYFNNANNDSFYKAEDGDTLVNQTITRNTTVKWQVLKNDGKNITLISDKAIDNVYFANNSGAKNGANILDSLVNSLYGGSKADEARNLKIEDINSIFRPEFNADLETNWTYKDASGTVHSVPAGAKTIGALINATGLTLGNNTKTPDGTDINNYVPNYYSFDPGNTKGNISEADKTRYQSNPAYNLVFNATTDSTNGKYLLSSNATHFALSGLGVDYNIRYVKKGYVGGAFMSSSGNNYIYQVNEFYSYRPVIVLKAGTEFEPATAINGTAAWNIK